MPPFVRKAHRPGRLVYHRHEDIAATSTEGVLEGARPTPDVAALAAETLAAELRPIDDVRSRAEYRRTVAARILHRMLRDAGGW